jgi:antitoxin VapB
MAISIKSEVADRLARDLADLTGESITDAVLTALSMRLEAERISRSQRRSALDLAAEFRRLQVFDDRSAVEILGYDANGLPS